MAVRQRQCTRTARDFAHQLKRISRIARSVLLASAAGAAQAVPQTPQISRAATGWTYAFAKQPVSVRGVLILMPGYGGDFSDFSTQNTAGLPLADSLALRDIATLMIAPPAGALFGGALHVEQLEDTIVEALRRIGRNALPLAIGGFSAGGTDAILFAERCGRGACRMPHALKAVIEVDAPLDWYRVWDVATLALRDRAPRSNLAESRLIKMTLEARIGAHPATTSRKYLAASPLASREPDGGNARWLVRTAVRAYSEPDVSWWMTNRNGDYYGLNTLDAASLVMHLRRLGNNKAELIVTTGRGYRADGTRHPHSWSIVNQPEFASWVASQLNP
jgi:hypothetical protein